MPRKEYLYVVIFLACVIISIAAVLLLGGSNKQRSTTSRSTMQFGGDTYTLEIADTESKRIAGLSNRERLEKDAAMLFEFPETYEQCMWMKDMKFSLDILWLDSSKKIVKVAENITPETYPRTFCAEDTKYVLELNAGVVKKNNLKVGQNLNF